MRRRQFLATLGGALVTANGVRAAATTASPTGESGPGTDESRSETGTVVAQGTVDRTLALSPATYATPDRATVKLRFVAPATDEGPAVVRTTLANANDFENTFRLDETPPFDPTPTAMPETTAGRLPLFLAPTENHDLREEAPDFERTADGRWLLADEENWLPETVTLGPGESVRGEYFLLGHPDSQKPPLGRYEIAPSRRGRHSSGPGPALGLTAWPTSRPGPEGYSAFEGADPPALPMERPVNWYHEADSGSPVYLEPSAEFVGLPARIDFTLHDHSRRTLSCESYRLFRLTEDGWQRLAWDYPVQACFGVSPGERRRFRLRAFPGKVLDGGDGAGLRGLSMQLDPGRYAFAVGYDEEYAALFDVGPTGCNRTDR